MDTKQYPDCPECDKMIAVKNKSQPIGEFLDWLQNEKGFCISEWSGKADENGDEYLLPVHKSIEQWIADYFNIDLNKVEQERRAVLDYLRME